jgi:hypothetical protein
MHSCYEGHGQSVTRPTGDGETNDFERIEAMIEVKFDDNFEIVFEKLAKMGAEIAAKIQINSFKTMDQTLSKLGRTIDGKGKPWTEQYLEMMSSVMIPLNDDGELDLSGLRIVAGSAISAQAALEMQELEADPIKKKCFNERLNAILAKKKEEALALEANRKLVG